MEATGTVITGIGVNARLFDHFALPRAPVVVVDGKTPLVAGDKSRSVANTLRHATVTSLGGSVDLSLGSVHVHGGFASSLISSSLLYILATAACNLTVGVRFQGLARADTVPNR
jgi:hypothetical protein